MIQIYGYMINLKKDEKFIFMIKYVNQLVLLKLFFGFEQCQLLIYIILYVYLRLLKILQNVFNVLNFLTINEVLDF